MMFFASRSAARNFASKNHRKVVDLGSNSKHRWAVKVL